MTPNDESRLTAYLDGELEADQRSAFESELLTDSRLAQRLRGLAEVRALVADLPRPMAPVDLALDVAARIDARALPARSWHGLIRPPVLIATAALGSFALAASLFIALVVIRQSVPPAPRRATAPGNAIAALPAPGDASQPTSNAEQSASLASPEPEPDRLVRNREELATADKVRALLDSPRLRRVLIVTDVIGETTLERVERLVQTTPRTDAAYGRIAVSQGIVVDPLRPNEATVFALVMNEDELKHFKRKLEQSFPQGVEDTEADPVVVAQLGEIGRLSVLPGTPASSVVIPSQASPRIALRSNPTLVQPAIETHVATEFGRPDLAAAAGVGAPRGPAAGPVATAAAPSASGTRDEPRARELPPGDEVSPAQAAAGHAVARNQPGSGRPPDAPESLDESLRTIHDPPEIVLVWVTSF
jgi:hypothetical protein